jgi:ribosomal protein S12 methylthiotransferase
MRELPNVCKYLDIPFQHSSSSILGRMKRGHTHESNLELIDTIRKTVPGIALRTTLMTGFPGETDADFDNLKQFVEQVRFDRLGVFTYSEEENTPAANRWKDDVPERIKRERADEIMEIQQAISASLNAEKIGSLVEAVVDAKEGQFYIARTEADSPEVDQEVLIAVSSGKLEIGNFYQVKIMDAEAFDLYGEVEL